jgi:hypothetical protein
VKFECKDLERCLEVPELMADAREHARNCPACRRELWVWSEMSNLASGLREEWDTPELWPKIRTQLAAQPKRKPVRRYDWRLLGAIAAVLLLAASGLTWFRVRPAPAVTKPASAEAQGDFLTEQTLKEVEQAEKAYANSIEKLSRIAAPKLENADTALIAAYREKLVLLDSAIADMRSSVTQNRFNTRLQMELAALYKQKQETLQEIVRREQKN